jgi:hypothetical protein
MHQLNACRRDRSAPGTFEAEHDLRPGLDVSMVLLDQVFPILRGTDPGLGRQQAVGNPKATLMFYFRVFSQVLSMPIDRRDKPVAVLRRVADETVNLPPQDAVGKRSIRLMR